MREKIGRGGFSPLSLLFNLVVPSWIRPESRGGIRLRNQEIKKLISNLKTRGLSFLHVVEDEISPSVSVGWNGRYSHDAFHPETPIEVADLFNNFETSTDEVLLAKLCELLESPLSGEKVGTPEGICGKCGVIISKHISCSKCGGLVHGEACGRDTIFSCDGCGSREEFCGY
jgi:hypothetical protein